MKLKRTHRIVMGKLIVYVEEYATVWKISAKAMGYAMPCAVGWRYKKKEHPTPELVAYQVASEIDLPYEYENELGHTVKVHTNYHNFLWFKMCYGVRGLSEREHKLYKTR